MNIATRIRDCRYAKGWGPDELALRAEISRTALYQIECGRTETPRAGTLRRIAQALDVSIEMLRGKEEPDREMMGANDAPAKVYTQRASERELDRKFHELLASPLGEGLARLVEESHRLLPSREGV